MKKCNLLKKDFGEKLLNKIKNEDIKQVSKNIFLFKNICVWFFFILSVFIGGLSISITFEYLFNADWSLLHRLGIIKIATIFMPVFWLFFLVFATFISNYNYRKTEKGYKLTFLKIFVVNILLSLLLSVIFYFSGLNHHIESKLENIVPKYRESFVKDRDSRMIKVWQNEDKGLLIGTIKSRNGDILFLQDFNKKNWEIFLNKNTQTDIKHKVNITVGEKIKIIGEKMDNNKFIANEIRPFIGRRR